ncbi:hypothetical protein ACWJJH_02360 [Endozoicomonadaceae bacterium StTr2]
MIDTIIGILIPLAIIGLFLLAPVWVNTITIAEKDKSHWAYPVIREAYKSPRSFSGRLMGQPMIFFGVTQMLTDVSFTTEFSVPWLLIGLFFTIAGDGVVKAFLTCRTLRNIFALTLAGQCILIALYYHGFLSIVLHYLLGCALSVYQAFVIILHSLKVQQKAAG